MKNITASKEIIPWTCHVCGGQFDTPGGGICSRCNRATCRNHLHLRGKKVNLDLTWVCDMCLTTDERAEQKKNKKIFWKKT